MSMPAISGRDPRQSFLSASNATSRLLEFATAAFLGALLVGGANMPKHLGFYLGLLVFGISLLRSPGALLRAAFASRLTLPLLGLFAAGVWGSLMSEFPAASWTSFYRHDNLGMAILFGLMLSHERPDAGRIKRLLVWVLLVFAGMNLWQMIHMARNPVFVDPAAYSYGELWKAREFGEILILLAPFVWLIPGLFGVGRTRLVTMAWTALIVLLLLPTGYRGAWVGFAIGASVWIVGRRRWKMLAWAIAAVAMIAVTLPMLPGRNAVTQAIGRGLDDNHRIDYIWKPTLEYVRQRPMAGYGFGHEIFIKTLHADPRADSEWIKWMLSDPHSNTLAIQFAAGVPGSLAYALLILTCLIAAAKQARTAATKRRRQANLALLAAWAATFVSLGQLDIVNWNYFGFLVVLSVVLHRQQDEASETDGTSGAPSRRRVLFVIRDKLGDSLLAFATVQQYLRLRPGDDVTVLMRKDYAELVAGEGGFALVRYRGGAQALLWALMQRLFAPPFDALVVLRGFGDRVRKLGALIPARRRISFSGKLAPTFGEWPPAFDSLDWSLVEPSFRAAAVLEPGLAMPDRLDLPGLRTAVATGGEGFVGVCPITDEKRKDLTQRSLDPLLDHIARTHPGVPIRILVRDGAEGLFDLKGRARCELVNFRDLHRLRGLFGTMSAYYGADTGLYHLAAAMGIPATVVFGPTQPGRIILPRQDAASVRLEVLAEVHCDVKSCRNPVCIEQACANLGSDPVVIQLDTTPPECPLRRHAPEARRANRWHRYRPEDLSPKVPQGR